MNSVSENRYNFCSSDWLLLEISKFVRCEYFADFHARHFIQLQPESRGIVFFTPIRTWTVKIALQDVILILEHLFLHSTREKMP